MKGLILKDFYNMSGQFKIYLIMPVMGAIIGYTQQSLDFMQIMMSIVVLFIPLSAFAYDEMCDFDAYAMTLPINRLDLVLCRYVLSLLVAITIGVIAILSAFLMVQIFGADYFGGIDLKQYAAEELAICLALNAIACILLPLLFKFGSEKARIVLMLIFLVITIGAFSLSGNLMSLSIQIDETTLLWIFAIAMIIIEGMSLWISNRIIAKKEF